MKVIIDSRTLKKVSKKLHNHAKTLRVQPLSLEINIDEADEINIKVVSEESHLDLDFFVLKI